MFNSLWKKAVNLLIPPILLFARPLDGHQNWLITLELFKEYQTISFRHQTYGTH